MNLLKDIYFNKEYVSLYLKEGEEVFEFKYSDNNNVFYNLAIKKPINLIGNIKINEGYYDVETAYGYGGHYCNTNDSEFINKAIEAYSLYCKKNNIIADFSRIHPFNETHFVLNNYYEKLLLDRKTISVDTKLSSEERWGNYPSKLRTILRKCKKELTFRKSTNLEAFIDLYEKTMQKNEAEDFYYFNKSYFEKLIEFEGVELFEVVFDNKIISSSFVLFDAELGHYHLSANDYEYRKYNANYFILDSIFNVAHERGIEQFHLGGGRTNTEEDTLLKFKMKFSSIKKNFFISGKVHNELIYNKYINLWEKQSDKEIKYFLKYRLDI